jgi:hypothetical protein
MIVLAEDVSSRDPQGGDVTDIDRIEEIPARLRDEQLEKIPALWSCWTLTFSRRCAARRPCTLAMSPASSARTASWASARQDGQLDDILDAFAAGARAGW